MATDEVRLRLVNCDGDGAKPADVEISESGFTVAEDRWTEGTEVTIQADGGEWDIVYVGDKDAGGEDA